MVHSSFKRLPEAVRRRRKLFNQPAVVPLGKPGPIVSRKMRAAIAEMDTASQIVNTVTKKDDWSVWNVAIQRCGELRRGSEVIQLAGRAHYCNINRGPDGETILLTALHRCRLLDFAKSWFITHGHSNTVPVLEILLHTAIHLNDLQWGTDLYKKLPDSNTVFRALYLITWYPDLYQKHLPNLSANSTKVLHTILSTVVLRVKHFRNVNDVKKTLQYAHIFSFLLWKFRHVRRCVTHFTLITTFFRVLGYPRAVLKVIRDIRGSRVRPDPTFCLAVCKAAVLIKKGCGKRVLREFVSMALKDSSSTRGEVQMAKYLLCENGRSSELKKVKGTIAMRKSDADPNKMKQLLIERGNTCPRCWSLLISLYLSRGQAYRALETSILLRSYSVPIYDVFVSAVLLAMAARFRCKDLAKAVLSLFRYKNNHQKIKILRRRYLKHNPTSRRMRG
eukprot:TRINITY_DN6321_c0_g1_i1.p1 TRINITY_DN6321_c0_g1~~TRINITY_DN6321_c0_g1_i1.p1  ORF type:complete len:447 (+),score=42.15 TRINITY_DN6321_c0_g1_i1:211-1551(+)